MNDTQSTLQFCCAGMKLLIRKICKRYDVSLSPMREALNGFSAEQLVDLNDQRDFAVSGVSKERLKELTRSRVLAATSLPRVIQSKMAVGSGKSNCSCRSIGCRACRAAEVESRT